MKRGDWRAGPQSAAPTPARAIRLRTPLRARGKRDDLDDATIPVADRRRPELGDGVAQSTLPGLRRAGGVRDGRLPGGYGRHLPQRGHRLAGDHRRLAAPTGSGRTPGSLVT